MAFLTVKPERLKKGLWWDRALRLVAGCTPVSAACKNCWAAKESHIRGAQKCDGMKKLYGGVTGEDGNWTGDVRFIEDRVELPMSVKNPTVWAVWNDLFHEKISASQITKAFEVFTECRQHVFIVLTKRVHRIASVLYGEEGRFFLGGGDYLPNVIIGTTVENQDAAEKRVPELALLKEKHCHAWKVMISAEPLLAEVSLKNFMEYIDWVVAGGESGANARPMHPNWVKRIRDDCSEAGVPFFFKQWGEWMPRSQMDCREEHRDMYLNKIRKKRWGVLNIKGRFFENTTLWNGREGEKEDEYEYAIYRVGKKVAGRSLDYETYLRFPDISTWGE